MIDRRKTNANWKVVDDAGKAYSGTYDHAILAVLMDIRDELQKANERLIPLRILECHNFIAIPLKLDAIVKQTRKRKAKRS